MTSLERKWTNESVVRLAGQGDPVIVIVEKARQIALEAMDAGWPGPPFDPLWLARHLGLEVAPRNDILDARTVPIGPERVVIEYNPNRPRGRVRYSIAHEIAHTLFPDCGQEVRNRELRDEVSAATWQLEMLCNIAAAELIMPIGTFPDLREEAVGIDRLMEIRRAFDVSTEALLLRFIRLTNKECCLIAASHVETGPFAGRYRIDYAVPSNAWADTLPGPHLADPTVAAECVAIGYTAIGYEPSADGDRSLRLECVGVAAYPGGVKPRVLGLLLPQQSSRESRSIRYLVGDAAAPRGPMPAIIAHVMNDRSPTWGGGFAKQLAVKFGKAQIEYRGWFSGTPKPALGDVHCYGDEAGILIATIIAQAGMGRSESPSIRYPALKAGLEKVSQIAARSRASVHMPRLGCGIAGGKWPVVAELVQQLLVDSGVDVVVYDPAPRAGK